jgi:hypothetical protein
MRAAESRTSTGRSFRRSKGWWRKGAWPSAYSLESQRLGVDAARAEALLAQLKSGEAQGPLQGWAIYHVVYLETDQAAEWFEKAIQQREFGVTILVQFVRKSSRWPALAKMMNLPETAAWLGATHTFRGCSAAFVRTLTENSLSTPEFGDGRAKMLACQRY